MVPEAETLCRMVLLVALTSVGAAVDDEDERVAAQAPPPPTMTNPMTTATIVCRLLKAGALRRTGFPFVVRGMVLARHRVLPLAGSALTAGCGMGQVIPRLQGTHPAHGFVSLQW